MSYAATLHAEHKARLERMGSGPVKAKVYDPPPAPRIEYPKFNVQTLYYHQMWFFDLITERKPREAEAPKIELIQQVVARYFGISKLDMISQRRTKDIVRPRQIAMYLAKALTGKSLPEIGRRFGGRDHTTVLHAINKIHDRLDFDEDDRRDVALIKAGLR
jgi:hypothetical protein